MTLGVMGNDLPQRKFVAKALIAQRADMVRYAGAVSGNDADAEDLVQDAWIKCEDVAHRQLVERPDRLIWRVLRNLSIDRRRQISRQGRTVVQDVDEDRILLRPDERVSLEHQLIARDELSRIEAAMANLAPRTRKAFEMHRLEGARLRDIAEELQISTTVAHRLVADGLAAVRSAVRQER